MSRPPVALGRADALRLARRAYLAGEPISVNQLADELGINRVTLFRWVGGRDALLTEVMWGLADQTMRRLWAAMAEDAGPRVPRLLADWLRATMRQPGARRFALQENERLMRIATLAEHGFQPRLMGAVRGYLEADLATGRATPTLGLDDLTYACVRITESFYYLPTITGQAPDPDAAQRVLHALMGSTPARAAVPPRPGCA